MELPEERIGGLLREARATLAVAESCTGGLLAHRITNVPGSSDYFLGGFVTYSNSLKETVLLVDSRLLASSGAVSPETALAMAVGARRVTGADWALAVTGIAGPGGGTPEKPVGLVYIALEGPRGTKVAEHRFEGGRLEIKNRSVEAALAALTEAVSGRP